ncbi:sigma-70 family RNA polymerase sigma factor [Bacillus alkalicellulosilyticus]|uniref:sigma-70 family RNA polymerase sigma factor n=1 Tax=Alkalihalobacterium alkalicellulosilyticum TaxID=1912214 RepID=UPI0009988AAD|nr:sigma-70 family RNA polymerase sigma factor [Bacillus alkalicellulosilyticus]
MEEVQQAMFMTTDDRDALLQELMESYGDDILRLVYSYIKDRSLAEDLTQEIFIKCFTHLQGFQQQSSIKTWLYRIASNHCKDYLRSWHYRKMVLSEKVGSVLTTKDKEVEDEVVGRSEEKQLAEALLTLPVRYREVLYFHYFEEWSVTEISKLLEGNPNTVKTRLKRGRELLKLELERRGIHG